MKVALVHDFLNQYGGAERVLEAQCAAFPGAPVYTMFVDLRRLPTSFRRMDLRCSFLQRMPLRRRFYRLYLPLYPLAIEQFNLEGYDVVLSNSGYCKGVLTRPETYHLTYCHTPIRYLWDWHFHYPREQNWGPCSTALARGLCSVLRVWDFVAAARPQAFLTNSAYVAQRIAQYYRREAEVLYPPVDTAKFVPGGRVEDYYLLVSRLSPSKAIDLAIEAFNQLGRPLVIIGRGPDRRRLERMAKPHIAFLGWQPDHQLAQYYAHCRALIFPVEEDLGIVPLEAQAAGRPVIAYGKGGALETVIEGQTGAFFYEPTPECLAEVVRKFTWQSFDPVGIRQHAQAFDTRVFQKKLQDLVEERWHPAASETFDSRGEGLCASSSTCDRFKRVSFEGSGLTRRD